MRPFVQDVVCGSFGRVGVGSGVILEIGAGIGIPRAFFERGVVNVSLRWGDPVHFWGTWPGQRLRSSLVVANPEPAALAFSRGEQGELVFLRQHEGEDADGLGRIGGVFAAELQIPVVVVDLPEDGCVVVDDAAEVVFAVRVVGLVERVEQADLADDDSLVGVTQRLNSGRYHHQPAGSGAAEFVIQAADGFPVGGSLAQFIAPSLKGVGREAPTPVVRLGGGRFFLLLRKRQELDFAV